MNLLISLHGIMCHDSIVQHKKFQVNWMDRSEVSLIQEGEMVQFLKRKGIFGFK